MEDTLQLQRHPTLCWTSKLCEQLPAQHNSIYSTVTIYDAEQGTVLLKIIASTMLQHDQHVCYKMPVICPVDYKSDELIWLICDTSKTGIGAMYGQGPSWTQCRPAGLMSKKFTYPQQHYAVMN